jgi:hypothetical protein
MWQLDILQDPKLNALAAPSLAEAGLLIVSLRCERQRPERVRALIDERLAQIVNPECALVVTVKKHRRQGPVGTDAVGRDVGHRYAARDSGALCRNAVPRSRVPLAIGFVWLAPPLHAQFAYVANIFSNKRLAGSWTEEQ